MNIIELQKFDLTYPGHWIAGKDRDWANRTSIIISSVDSELVSAVSSFAMFKPITRDYAKQLHNQSKYERCLNGIYATSFVFSLDAISKLLNALKLYLSPPDAVLVLISEYETVFGHLKYIRDSLAHIEDRSRGVGKNKKEIPTNLISLGSFINETGLEVTASNGNLYRINLSDSTLLSAHRIIQGIINSYTWE